MKRKITESHAAIRKRIKHWLPDAEEGLEELEAKVKNATSDRAGRILQRHTDELRAQIDDNKRKLEEVRS